MIEKYKGYCIEYIETRGDYRVYDPIHPSQSIAYVDSIEEAKQGIDEQLAIVVPLNRPYNQCELFDEIIKRVNLPDFVEYAQSPRYDTKHQIKYYEFVVVTETKHGGSEGVYTDVYIAGYIRNADDFERIHIGTIKTLDEGPEAIREMYSLAADVYIAGNDYINKNLDAFTWIGYQLTLHPGDKIHFEYGSKESLNRGIEQFKERGEDLSEIQIIDRSTRKEIDPEPYIPKDDDIDI